MSLDRLGDVLMKAGEWGETQKRFEQSLGMKQKLAAANPGSAEARRDVSVSLDRLGDVFVKAGKPGEARARFEQSMAIREKLAAANPGSAEAQRDLIVSYAKLGGLTNERQYWQKGLAVAEALENAGRLAPSDRWMLKVLAEKAAAAKP